MNTRHSKIVKEHFEIKYQDYNVLICKLIPYYKHLQGNTIRQLKLAGKEKARILELGIGTGLCTERLLNLHPKTNIVGVDISPSMLKQGMERLNAYGRQVKFFEQDISKLQTQGVFNGCFGVLTVHHLKASQKKKLFKRVYKILSPNSHFVIGDLIKFSTKLETTQKEILWKQRLFRKFGKKQGQYWFDNYLEEDIPSTIPEQLKWLREAGFKSPKCTWKYLNYAVICAVK